MGAGLHRGGLRAVITIMSTSDPINAIEEAESAGFDMSLVDQNLTYSHEQRALNHQAALNFVLELQKAGRRLRGRHQQADSTPD